MRHIISFLLFLPVMLQYACNESGKAAHTTSFSISSPDQQTDIFRQLTEIARIDPAAQSDSLSILLLPLDESCPSCRDKAIDSIMKFRNRIPPHSYIVLSLNGGLKSVRGFFKDAGHDLPVFSNRILIDSLNLTGKYKLCDQNPAFYFIHSGKAYKKVHSLPSSIKDDLSNFFRKNN